MVRAMGCLMCFLGYLGYCSGDRFVWWSIFLMSTIVFVYYLKLNGVEDMSLILYFLLQEVAGFIYLICGNWVVQFLVLMFKSGVSPLHFWLFNVLGEVKGYGLSWFLVLQKLPYFFGLVEICSWGGFVIVLLGLVVCHLHLLVSRFFVFFLSIVVTESFSWLLMLCYGLGYGYEFFFLVYYLGMFFVVPFICDFYSGRLDVLGVMIFFNVPLTFTFFVKVMTLIYFGFYIGYFLFFLLMLPIMSFGLIYFYFLGNIRYYLNLFKVVGSSVFYFLVVLMGLLFI